MTGTPPDAGSAPSAVVLTGRSGRAAILDDTRRSLAAIRSGTVVVAIAVDLVDFDDLLVACGDATGHIILSEMAELLAERLFPDRFSICLENTRYLLVAEVTGGADSVQTFMSKVHRCFVEPVVAANTGYYVYPRIGVTFSSRKNDDARLLLGAAEVACAKAHGTGTAEPVVFDRESRERVHEDFDLAQALHDGIAKGELLLRYQPIVDLQRRAPMGLVSEVGWTPLNGDLLSNDELLHYADKHGLLLDLGDWVLQAFVAQWSAVLPLGKDISLSVSVRLTSQQLGSWLARSSDRLSLARSSVPGRLSIEVLDNYSGRGALGGESLEWLHRLGIGVVMNAFEGLPLLTTHHAGSIEGLRLEPGLVAQIGQGDRERVLLASVIDLAHEFGVATIAEGVRDQSQIDALAELGCDYAHSYFAPGPLALDEATSLLGAT